MSNSFKPPGELNFDTLDGKNLAETWRIWKEEVQLYFDVAMPRKTDEEKAKAFLYIIGRQGREIHKILEFNNMPENRTATELFAKFDEYCTPKKNLTVKRHKFFTRAQKADESIDQFVIELRTQASECNFENLRDSLIKDILICVIRDRDMKERLLRESDLDLAKALQMCRAAELSKEQARSIASPSSSCAVYSVHTKQPRDQSTNKKPRKSTKPRQEEPDRQTRLCGKYGSRRCAHRDRKALWILINAEIELCIDIVYEEGAVYL